MIPSLKEVLAPIIVSETAQNAIAMWIKKDKEEEDDKDELDTFARYLLKEYRDRLVNTKQSIMESAKKMEEEGETTKKRIRDIKELGLKNGREILEVDVCNNKSLLENFIEERRSYIDYATKILKKVQDTKKAPLSPTGILEEVLDFTEETFSSNIKIHINMLKQLEAQYNNLIKIDEMSDKDIEQKLGAKIRILKDDLTILEDNLAGMTHDRISIVNKIKEIEEIIGEDINNT